jgi:hypothetical protein
MGMTVCASVGACAPPSIEPRAGQTPAGPAAPQPASPPGTQPAGTVASSSGGVGGLAPFAPRIDAGIDAGAEPAAVEPQRPVAPLVCKKDEVRELVCVEGSVCPGELLPGHGLPLRVIERPLDTGRPSRMVLDLTFAHRPRFASLFDPGQPCCYAVCDPIVLSSAKLEPGPSEMLCVGAPEGGTSRPAPPPHQRCPRAVVIPGGLRPAVLDDNISTTQSATFVEPMCCYSYPIRHMMKVGRLLQIDDDARSSRLVRGGRGWGAG